MNYATELTRQMMELLESRRDLHGIVIIRGKEDGRGSFCALQKWTDWEESLQPGSRTATGIQKRKVTYC